MTRPNTLVLLLGAAVALYIVSKLSNTVKKATEPIADVIAKIWTAFDPIGVGDVLGAVEFPNGDTVALKSLQVRGDRQGNVFTLYAGHVYALQPHNARGNWPATLVR